MDKVICDICGTAYPETEEKCPLCGCTKEFAMDLVGTGVAESKVVQTNKAAEPAARKKNKEIFDFDEVNQVKQPRRDLEEEDYDEEPEEEEESRTNVFLVVILVILIVLLLLSSGFFFLRYFLPNMKDTSADTEPVVTTMPVQTEPVETEDPGIPCTDLVIPGGKVELGKDGMWLLNVQVYPADTTDVLTYASGDEAVVTISEDGTVTAVGEGQTVITITCGDKEIHCNVTVDYSIGAETVPTGEIPAMQVEDSADPTEETSAEAETQATEATETTEETVSLGTELKLKKTDITISSNRTSVKLELDCDIKPEDVKWFTMDSTVAIVHDGVVTSIGSGMTRIYGEYSGQQVMCIVRCIF